MKDLNESEMAAPKQNGRLVLSFQAWLLETFFWVAIFTVVKSTEFHVAVSNWSFCHVISVAEVVGKVLALSFQELT